MIRCVHRATDTSLAFCLTRSGEDHLDNCLHDNNFIKRLINETQRSQILILIVSVNYSNPPDIVNNTVVDKKTPLPVLTLGQLCVLHRVSDPAVFHTDSWMTFDRYKTFIWSLYCRWVHTGVLTSDIITSLS